ncbi:hypothetical protein E2C01_001970 [Portunus trituberculatus]|uniref:Uncharacterized protein n=1 Tax=Portunus trituberculatus TaxID=210409 RepID=A0A5B7CKN9_PORTR|nr:hypothetical protein [Portunus trituberculatus]
MTSVPVLLWMESELRRLSPPDQSTYCSTDSRLRFLSIDKTVDYMNLWDDFYRSRSLIHVEDFAPPTRNKLKVFYVNVRIFRNKFSELEEIGFTDGCDVIGVTVMVKC